MVYVSVCVISLLIVEILPRKFIMRAAHNLIALVLHGLCGYDGQVAVVFRGLAKVRVVSAV
jgi:hypothetical protein